MNSLFPSLTTVEPIEIRRRFEAVERGPILDALACLERTKCRVASKSSIRLIVLLDMSMSYYVSYLVDNTTGRLQKMERGECSILASVVALMMRAWVMKPEK
jgi:hypothetical protein